MTTEEYGDNKKRVNVEKRQNWWRQFMSYLYTLCVIQLSEFRQLNNRVMSQAESLKHKKSCNFSLGVINPDI